MDMEIIDIMVTTIDITGMVATTITIEMDIATDC